MARRARVKVLCDEEERVIAVHDGYKRLRCLHTRKVEKMKEHIRIVDEIDCEGMAYLHFMPKENIVLDGNRLLGSDYCIEFKGAVRLNHSRLCTLPNLIKEKKDEASVFLLIGG